MVATKRCAYGTCKNDSRYPERMHKNEKGDPVTFFHFPGEKRHPEKRKQWIEACKRGDSFNCNKDSYVCSIHFVGQNGPTVDNPNPISATTSNEKLRMINLKRKRPAVRRNPIKKPRPSDVKSAASSLLMLAQTSTNCCKTEEDIYDIAETLLSLGANAGPSNDEAHNVNEDFDPFRINIDETSNVDKILKVETPVVEKMDNAVLCSTQTNVELSHLNPYQDKMLMNSAELHKNLFLAKVEDPNKTMHYTGMSKECLNAIFNEVLKSKAKRIHFWRGKKRTKLTTSHSMYIKRKYDLSKLTTREQFLFTLVRLRRNVSIEMLSDIFGISNGSGSRIFITWILFLSHELKFLLPFSTLKDLQGIEFPKSLRSITNLRAIIDCTEFHIEKPSRPHCQRATYSQYKSTNTFKLLISMSPVPHINFVSRLFTGSISDKQIVKESGFLEQLEAGDVVMADKGFNIQDLLALHESRLLAPPLLRKGNVSAASSTQTRRIAKIRVHIERMIRKLKCFTILKGAFPLSMKPYVNSIVTVCAALVNLQPSCINKKKE